MIRRRKLGFLHLIASVLMPTLAKAAECTDELERGKTYLLPPAPKTRLLTKIISNFGLSFFDTDVHPLTVTPFIVAAGSLNRSCPYHSAFTKSCLVSTSGSSTAPAHVLLVAKWSFYKAFRLELDCRPSLFIP